MESNVVIYQNVDGKVDINVKLDQDTVWLSLQQLADLFERDKSVISRHIKNIYNESELEPSATVAKYATVQTEGKRGIKRDIEYYNLDLIISVGYRVNSKKGIQFRRWASEVLKEHLIKGYTINQSRVTEQKLVEIQRSLDLLSETLGKGIITSDISTAAISLIADYSKTWDLLLKYDENNFTLPEVTNPYHQQLGYQEAKLSINQLKNKLVETKEASNLFGQEHDERLEAILQSMEQTFNQEPLYKTIEEKAAHLLYFIIKDHPFSDGNKRIGCLLFLLYLRKNQANLEGIKDTTLTALALLVAESAPNDKELIIKLIINLMI